jgi:putative oxidoreductase
MIDTRTAPFAALVLRMALGVMFIAHAALKYYVFTMPGTVEFFQSIGLPGGLAYLTVWAEFIGGALIVAGLYSRWVSAALVPLLLGATWAHAANGWVFTAANGGWEYPAFLAAAAVSQALLGDGRFALANLLHSRHLDPVPA